MVTFERVRSGVAVMTAVDEHDEGHLVLFRPEDPQQQGLRPGMRGVLVFTRGGPTGGYWKFFKSDPKGGAS